MSRMMLLQKAPLKYPALGKSYKKAYPFKIGATSFVYPDTYTNNVSMVGPYIDEVEILMFESNRESLPSKRDINELSRLARVYNISYNIHFPLDISLGHDDLSVRNHAIETVRQILDLTNSLAPSTYTLHLSYDDVSTDHDTVKQWRERIYKSMGDIYAHGIPDYLISIETLAYPIDWVDVVINDYRLSVCIDLGHLMFHNFDMDTVFKKYAHRTPVIHLHGIEKSRDHQPLDRLSGENLSTVMGILQQFRGVVSIEVFSFDYLNVSLEFFDRIWKENYR